MKHDADIDIFLSRIANRVLDEICQDISEYNFDPLLIGAEGPKFPQDSFFDRVRREHPASYHYAWQDGDPRPLIKQFHSMAASCGDATRYTLHIVDDMQFDIGDMEDIGISGLKAGVFFTRAHSEYSYSHNIAIVRVSRGDETGLFIIDPTFRQFSYYSQARDLEVSNTPAYRLSVTNPAMHDQLLNKGFAQLTPKNAEDYLRCFQKFDPDYAPIPDAYDCILEVSGLG